MAARIEFPNKGKREWRGIPLHCLALGRNGTINAAGLEVLEQDDVVTLSAITSKGTVGRCYIELPKDSATLRSVAEALLEIAARQVKGKAR